MEYQNRPVEWITTETEKIAKDKENNTVRDAALLAGGTGAVAGGLGMQHKVTKPGKVALKTLGIAAGVAGTDLGVRAQMRGMQRAYKAKHVGEAIKGLSTAYAGHDLARRSARDIFWPSVFMSTKGVDKKRLAAKLGLITGGAAAAAAGAHGLLKEKKASKEEIKDKKVYQDYVNRRQEGIRNQWKGIGGLLGGLTVGSALAATGTPLGAGLGTLAAIGGYGYGLGKLQQGDYQIGQASYIDPARRDNLFWDFSITPTEAKYTRDVGFLDRLTGAEVDVTKKASKENKKEKAPSGFNRATRALLGHLVLPAAGIGTALAGTHMHKKYPTYRGHAIRPGIGKALAIGGLATAAIGPWANDSYQAYKYIQEH